MNITILCVGRLTEKFFEDAVEEYKKRLSKYVNFKIVEVKDEKTKENATIQEINLVKDKEGKVKNIILYEDISLLFRK